MIFYAYFSFNTTNYHADASQNLRKKICLLGNSVFKMYLCTHKNRNTRYADKTLQE